MPNTTISVRAYCGAQLLATQIVKPNTVPSGLFEGLDLLACRRHPEFAKVTATRRKAKWLIYHQDKTNIWSMTFRLLMLEIAGKSMADGREMRLEAISLGFAFCGVSETPRLIVVDFAKTCKGRANKSLRILSAGCGALDSCE